MQAKTIPAKRAVRRKKFRVSRVIIYAVLGIWTLFLFLPVYTLLVSSITPAEFVLSTGPGAILFVVAPDPLPPSLPGQLVAVMSSTKFFCLIFCHLI